MGKYKYTLITSAILSCFLIGCGGSSKSSSENANAGVPAQQTEPVAPAEPVTPSEQNNPVEPQTAEISKMPIPVNLDLLLTLPEKQKSISHPSRLHS